MIGRRCRQRLQRLPDRPAPVTLMPRVLAAIQAQARLPWYRQPWSTWPHTAQGASLLVLSLLLGALTYACLHFPELGRRMRCGRNSRPGSPRSRQSGRW
jgi:hypothetical protein